MRNRRAVFAIRGGPKVPKPFRRYRVSPLPAMAELTVLLGCLAAAVGLQRGSPQVEVNGRPVTLEGARPSIETVLSLAHIRVGGGFIYTVSTHAHIPGHFVRPLVRLNGRPARLQTEVSPGDRIVVRSRRVAEPTVARLINSAIPGTPLVEYHLVGLYSGEVVSVSEAIAARAATPEKGKVVALTFDDGPDPKWTRAILQILASENVSAPFCTIGYNVQRYPSIVKSEVSQGETLCDHTADHDEHLNKAPLAHIEDQINRGASMVQGATGQGVAFYRPPGG